DQADRPFIERPYLQVAEIDGADGLAVEQQRHRQHGPMPACPSMLDTGGEPRISERVLRVDRLTRQDGSPSRRIRVEWCRAWRTIPSIGGVLSNRDPAISLDA